MENPSQPKTALQELHQPLPTLDDFKNNTVDHTQDCSKCKTLGTPDRLKLPKPFKYPERYYFYTSFLSFYSTLLIYSYSYFDYLYIKLFITKNTRHFTIFF